MTIAEDALRPDQGGAGEIILMIGFEGGSWTIMGIRTGDGWRFRMKTNTLALCDNEEDRARYIRASDWVDSFEAALALIDRYPWHILVPMEVHPDFRLAVWLAVEERRRRNVIAGPDDPWRDIYINEWRYLCHVEADPSGG